MMPDHVHTLGTGQLCGGGGVRQRQECDSPCRGVWREEAKFCGAELLRERLFCLDNEAG